MFTQETFRIEGTTPLLMHNGQLADPLNEFTKALKLLSSKKKKTDEIHMQMAEAEWMGGLYANEAGHPCVPTDNILAMIIAAAKKSRNGVEAKSGVFFMEDSFPLEYAGPKDASALWESGKFRDTRGVRVTTSRIMRTRPIFREWALEFSVSTNPEVIKPGQLGEWLVTGGQMCGIGDYRPRYGLFRVV